MKRKFWPLLMVIILAFSSVSVANAANSEVKEISRSYSCEWDNPVYEGVVTAKQHTPYRTSTFRVPEYTDKWEELVECLRDGMISRAPQVDVHYYVPSKEFSEEVGLNLLYAGTDLLEDALEESDNPRGGDYLRWSFWHVSVEPRYTYYDGDGYFLTYSFVFDFYTDHDQEERLSAEIEKVLNELQIKNLKHDYLKVKAIYDYICENIYYDYDGLEDETDSLKYTAYAALVEKSAVCQGYATLFYTMLEEAGVDARVISGISSEENHAWNIVNIGSRYYLADSTWDAERAHNDIPYAYFLKGTEYFENHVAGADYCSETFLAKYDLDSEDYVYHGSGDDDQNQDNDQNQDDDPIQDQTPVFDITRFCGNTRYETSYAIADALKDDLGVTKFTTVIVADGTNFPDALAGSYLAAKKNAPILMVNGKNPENIKDLQTYVEKNLAPNGMIYILGGTAAVSSKVETAMKACSKNITRLAGENRYETNLLILNEADVNEEEILVCTAKNFPDSLSASATGRPILLVNPTGRLSVAQKAFLQKVKGNEIYIIGGTGAVNASYEEALKAYDTNGAERIAGANRYDTSTLLAKKFFKDANQAVVAYAWNFPDGLCGGPLAYNMDAPLILTGANMTKNPNEAAQKASAEAATIYMQDRKITSGAILGGNAVLSDYTVRLVFNMKSTDIILEKNDN